MNDRPPIFTYSALELQNLAELEAVLAAARGLHDYSDAPDIGEPRPFSPSNGET